ncbi:MAG TPA: flagellar biosynthetic protein FliR [Paraburkholderia sp.]|jgi:type III secretory pathway component EscT
MNVFAYFEGLAFCSIRPAVALSLVPFAFGDSLGTKLRVPLVMLFAVLPLKVGAPAPLIPAALFEALVGLVLGLLLAVVFHVASCAGALLDQQGGYSIAAVYDPNFQQEAALFETLFTQFAALTFFTGPGLQFVCGFFTDAWVICPPGTAHVNLPEVFRQVTVDHFAAAFAEGIRLAMPLIGLMAMVDISLGLMSRHVKRLNPFTTARTVKAMVISFAAMSCVPVFIERLSILFRQSLILQ